MSQDPIAPPPPPAPPAGPPLPPAGGGGAAEGPRIPWEERDRLGFLDALIETVKLIATAPSDAFSRLRADGDLLWPLVFGLIFSWIGQVFGQIWGLLFNEAMRSMMSGFAEFDQFSGLMAGSVAGTLFWIVIWPVFYVLSVFIFAGLLHLALMLLGSVSESPLGFEGTLKVVAYASIADLANLIPILGWLIGLLLKLVLVVIGLTQVHRTTQGNALIAVLLVVVLCCCCVPAIAGGIMAMLGASLGALSEGFGG